MFYKICENGIFETDREEWEKSGSGAAVFDEEEWSGELRLQEEFSLGSKEKDVFFCKLEPHVSYLYGSFHVPVKKKEKRSFDFIVYILKDRLIFVEEESFISDRICKLQQRIFQDKYTIDKFLDDFFMILMEDDILYLASLEREIADLEEIILQGDAAHFNYRMLAIKKEISRLYCYYSQMADASELLSGEKKGCGNFSERVKRLQSEVVSLREYAMQVQDVYQAEISIHQNNVMKFLTVVTTICLPLTLIAGWYGMNFYNMPELSWQYGYPVVSGISLLVVIVCLWFFKKKKFF